MAKDNIKEHVIEGLVGWMENLEGASSKELSTIMEDLGYDVVCIESQFVETLREEYKKLGIELIVESKPTQTEPVNKPYLGYVSDETGEPPSAIALGVG